MEDMKLEIPQEVQDKLNKAIGKDSIGRSMAALKATDIGNLDVKDIVEKYDELDKYVKGEHTPTVKTLTADELANKPEDDVDFIEVVANIISKVLNPDIALWFRSRPAIIVANGRHSLYQRVIVNRFFTNLLVRFNGFVECNTLPVIGNLVKDGTHQKWTKLFIKEVLPFLVEYRVFEFFLARDAYIYHNRLKVAEEIIKNRDQDQA